MSKALFTIGFFLLLVSPSYAQIVFGGGGGGGGVTGWPSSSSNKEITWANALANAARIGDGVSPVCLYTDPTLGAAIRPCTDENVETIIPTNFTWCLRDIEGGSCMLTVDPDAANANAMYQFTSGYRPTKSIYFSGGALSTDGTQCGTPAEVTINSGPKLYTIICTDNDGSTIHGSVKMPLDYDGGTISFDQVIIQTASNTSALNGDIAAQCRGTSETPSSSYGTEVAMDVSNVVGSNANVLISSGAVTPTGTCAAGDMMYWQYQVDATGTTTAMATLHFVNFVLKYSSNSLSH